MSGPDEARSPTHWGGLRWSVAAVFALLLLWAPVPLGSNRVWSSSSLQLVVYTLLALLLIHDHVRPFARPRRPGAAMGRLPKAVLGAWALWLALIAVQLLPLAPGGLHATGSGGASSAWALYAQAPAAASEALATAPLSVDRGATLAALLRHGAGVCAFALVLMLARGRRAVLFFAAVVVAACTVEAWYGLVVHLGGAGVGLWDPRFSHHGVAGTYVNQNHFAGLMVIGIGVAAGLLGAVPRKRPASGWRGLAGRGIDLVQGPAGWLWFALVSMLSALLLSGSRGAIGALLAVALVMAAVSLARGRRRALAPLAGVVLAALLGALGLAGSDLGRKFQEQGVSSNRMQLADTTLALVRRDTLTGSGAGTFRWQFPAVRDAAFGNPYYQHAHNDWLEMLADHGVVGAGAWFAGLLLCFAGLVRALRVRHDPAARAVATGSLLAAGAFSLHALVDFNFSIPANALMFFVVLALGLNAGARATFERRESSPYRY